MYVIQYVQQIYSGKTKSINIAMYITMLTLGQLSWQKYSGA